MLGHLERHHARLEIQAFFCTLLILKRLQNKQDKRRNQDDRYEKYLARTYPGHVRSDTFQLSSKEVIHNCERQYSFEAAGTAKSTVF
jgi:hypothetical protein